MSDGSRASMRTARRQLLLLLCLLLALLLLLLEPAQAADSNPYSVLGLTRGATLTEIKKAYRRLSKQWHPDKSADPAAPERFLAINAAYDILSDQQKRDEFDRYGRVTSEQQRREREQQQRRHQQQQHAGFHWAWGSQQSVFQSYAAYATNTDTLSSSSPQLHKLGTDNYDTLVSSHTVWQHRTPEVWLVEIYAEVCGPCAAVHTAFAQTLRLLREMELSAVIKLGAVHADFESRLVHQLSVRSVPHVFSVSTDGRRQQARTLAPRPVSHIELLQHLSSIFIASLPPTALRLLHKLPLPALRPPLSLIAETVRPPHPSRPLLLLVSSVSSTPSLLLSYVMAYHASDFSFCYLHLPSLPSRSASVSDVAAALHIAASQLPRLQNREQDSIFVFNGDAAAPLSPVGSFASAAPVSSVLRLLAARLHVVAPPLTASNYFSLCVRRDQRSSSLPAEAEEGSVAGKKAACLVLLAASQQQADATLFPAFLHRPVVASASALLLHHNVQLSWLDPARQASFVLFFTQQHRSRQPPRALLLRAWTGQFAMWTADRTAGGAAEALHDWAQAVLEGDGGAWQDGWSAGGWPVLETEAASGWSAAAVDDWLLQLRDSVRDVLRLPADWWKRLRQLDFGIGLMAVAALLVCFTLLLSAS